MRLALTLVAGCHVASPVAPRATPIAPLPEPTFAERVLPTTAKTRTKERYGARDLFEPRIVGRDLIAQQASWHSTPVVDVAEIDYLGRCVKDYVTSAPQTARRSLVDAFAHYVVTCDAETGAPTLDRPLGLDTRDRKGSTDAIFVGRLTPGGGELVLRVTSCGTASTFDKITFAGADEQWTSQRLEVRRRIDGCDVAELPYSRRLGGMMLRAMQSDAAIRFDGTDNSLALDATLRGELRDVIDAVDAITGI